MQAFVISRLDYCNSLVGLRTCVIKPLQLIQKAAAHLVFNLPTFSHVTPLISHVTFHWLPAVACIHFKTLAHVYGAARGTSPPYLALRSATSWPSHPYGGQLPLSPVKALLCPGTPMVEWYKWMLDRTYGHVFSLWLMSFCEWPHLYSSLGQEIT